MYLYPVPTAYEVRLLLDYFENKPEYHIALCFITIQGLRPIEVARLKWKRLWFNDDKTDLIKMRHYVYKPSNRKTKIGKNIYFKEIEKPMWSPWFNKKIIEYSAIAPGYAFNKMFPFECPCSLNKQLTLLRKEIRKRKHPKIYDCFLESVNQVVQGASLTRYRINLYSLRRFCMTFHFWMTFNPECSLQGGDIIMTSRIFGHTNPATTLKHYVQPYQAIGLSQKMIKKDITMDEFIHLHGKKQMILDPFIEPKMPRFMEPGQHVLPEFFEEKECNCHS